MMSWVKKNGKFIPWMIAWAIVICGTVWARVRIMAAEEEVARPAPGRVAFDISALDNWGGPNNEGTVRMVGAWRYEGATLVEDEQGQVWDIGVAVSDEDFFLLWIADNNTPEDATDDVVIKAWKEAH